MNTKFDYIVGMLAIKI